MNEALQMRKSLRLKRRAIAVALYVLAVFSLFCLIGVIVAVMILSFSPKSSESDALLMILAGSMAGGAGLFGAGAFLLSKGLSKFAERELDCRERLVSEESFFVGEGTLATFEEDGVKLHSETGSGSPVHIPYRDIRFISVYTRRAPSEAGVPCVAVEFPVRYISKDGKGGEEKVLVQSDGKQRLYDAISAHGQPLFGELPKDAPQSKKKFEPVKEFAIPDSMRRKSALFMTAGGGLLVVIGIILGVLLVPALGAVLGAAGLILAGKSLYAFLRAKAKLVLYQEGFFWKESGSRNRLFVKWEDVLAVEESVKDGASLCFYCLYGQYKISEPNGAFEAIREMVPDKCRGKEE